MTNLEKWRLYTKDLESPNLYIDWAFYSLISSAVQRRVWYHSDPITKAPSHNSIFLNQFIILIGPPACGKGRAIKSMKAACTHDKNKRVVIDEKTKKVVVVTEAIFCTPDNITFEGLFKFVARQEITDGLVLDVADSEGKKMKLPYLHNSVTACIEELGVLFTKDTTDVASVLCQLYDAGSLVRYTKGAGVDTINNVCVNFLAGTTTDAIRRLMLSKVVEEGFSTRVIFIYAAKPRFYRFTSQISPEQQLAFNDIVEHVRYLATEVKGEITLTPDALAFMTEYYESGKLCDSERVNPESKLDGYYGRKKLHWYKLAAAIELSENKDSLIVSLDSAKKALTVLNTTEADMHLAFRDAGSNTQHEISSGVVGYIKHNKEASFKKILLNFFKDGTTKDLQEVMEYLVATSQVVNEGGVYKIHPDMEKGKIK